MYTITYNNKIFQNSDKLIINLEQTGKIPINTKQSDFVLVDGGIIAKKRYGMRDLVITGKIIENSQTDYHNARKNLVEAFFQDGVIKTLAVTYLGRGSFIDCTVIDFDFFKEKKGTRFMCDFEVVLRAPFPYFKGALLMATILPQKPGGTPVPMSVPSPVGNNQNTFGAFYGSIISCPPDIEFHGLLVNPSLANINSTQNYFLSVNNQTINNGEILYLNNTNNFFTASLNNINVTDKINGSFKLEKGVMNLFTLTATQFSGNAKAIIKYYRYSFFI